MDTGMSVASSRGAPGQRPEKDPKPPFGQRRTKPLKRKAPKPKRMSKDTVLQDAMLGRGRCWVADGMETDCTDGASQRSHIVSQQLIRNTFPLGAVRRGEVWVPIEEGFTYSDAYEFRTLQQILDDVRNIVPCCPNHNVDGPAMVQALGMVGTPDGFDEFLAEYQFSFSGRYWVREPQRKAA